MPSQGLPWPQDWHMHAHLAPPAERVRDHELIKHRGLDDRPVDALPRYVQAAVRAVRALPQIHPEVWVQVLGGLQAQYTSGDGQPQVVVGTRYNDLPSAMHGDARAVHNILACNQARPMSGACQTCMA